MTGRDIARLVACRLPKGLPFPILRGPLRGSWWVTGVGSGTGGGAAVFVNLTDPAVLERGAQLVTPQSVCLDVGAHVGLFTLLLARGRHVYAFEPVPQNIAALHRTLRLNHVRNVTIFPWALGATTEFASFVTGVDNSQGRLDAGGTLPVMTTSLDAVVARYGIAPNLIKIDVEGGEAEVLRGASTVLRVHRPTLLLSIHKAPWLPNLEDECQQILGAARYRCEALSPDGLETVWHPQ